MINWNRMSDDELEELQKIFQFAVPMYEYVLHYTTRPRNVKDKMREEKLALEENLTQIQEIQAKRAKARAINPNSLIDKDIGRQ